MDMRFNQPFYDDFVGPSVTLPTSANIATPWLVADTSSSGAPTYVRNGSRAILTMAATSEVENLCLYFGDSLNYDIDLLRSVRMVVKLGAAFTSGSELVFGVGSARNDTTDSVAANAWFKMVGANSTSLVYVESDDSVNDYDDKSTGVSLATTDKVFVIDFSNKADVKFLIDGQRVATGTTFNMSNYTAGLQPYVQLQKAANTNVDSVSIDFVEVDCRR